MPFREDLDAALARIDVLERENRQLIDENSRLRRARSPYRTPIRKLRVQTDLDAAMAHVDTLGRENRRIGAENDDLRAGAPAPSPDPSPRPWPLDDALSINLSPRAHNTFAVVVGVVLGTLFMLVAAAIGK